MENDTTMAGVEDRLVSRVASVSLDQIPDDVTQSAILTVFDTLAVAAGGVKAPGAEQVLLTVKMNHSPSHPGWVTVPWAGIRVPPADAALALASMIHAWDFDDTHDVAGIHACVSSLTAAVVTGMSVGATDQLVLEGVIAGVEVASRLGMALGAVLSTGISRTTTCSVFGAAAAAARVLDLGEDGLRRALSIAVSMAGSTRQVVIDGAVTKRLQPAFATRNGLLAAQLAASGVSGPHGWLRGDAGVRSWSVPMEGFANRLDADGSVDWEVGRLSLKPYPACRFTHTSISAAREAFARGIDTPTRVAVRIPAEKEHALVARPWARRGNPIVDAQFSVPWLVAATVIDGSVDLTTLATDRLFAEDIAMMAKNVTVDQNLPVTADTTHQSIPQTGLPAEVTVFCSDGTSVSTRSDIAPGSPDAPLTWDEVEEKARSCAIVGQIPEEEVFTLARSLRELKGRLSLSTILTTW